MHKMIKEVTQLEYVLLSAGGLHVRVLARLNRTERERTAPTLCGANMSAKLCLLNSVKA